jgi:hypothetical protein
MNLSAFAALAVAWRNRVHHALAILGGVTIIVAVDAVAAWYLFPHFRQAIRPLIVFMTGGDLYR